MVSAASNNVLFVLPRKGVYEINRTGDIVWSFSWKDLGRHPHEPEILPSGNMVVVLRKPHRVVEIERKTKAILWEFSKSGVETIRDADRLPNGNTLIVERTKILEVTTAGKVVWQLRVRDVSGKKRDKTRWFYKAERIAPH